MLSYMIHGSLIVVGERHTLIVSEDESEMTTEVLSGNQQGVAIQKAKDRLLRRQIADLEGKISPPEPEPSPPAPEPEPVAVEVAEDVEVADV